MGKYVIIQDMRHLPSYKNVNARLVYLHLALCADIETYTTTKSLRVLAMELDMTVDTIRHALKVLERDGLVTPMATPQGAPQGAPQGTPQRAPQRAPHLTTLRINKNGAPNGAPNTTPNTTPSTTPSTTDNPNIFKNNNNKNNNYSALTDARARWGDLKAALAETLRLQPERAAAMADEFRRRQLLKGKTWESEGDLLAHLIAWAEKRIGGRTERTAAAAAETEAQHMERQRQQEEQEERMRKAKADRLAGRTGRTPFIDHLRKKAAAGEEWAAAELAKIEGL